MPDNCLRRDSSGRLAFEMYRVSAADYPERCNAVATTFGLKPDDKSFAVGLDVVFMDYRRGEQVVEMAWDSWTGFSVVAKNAGSKPLVREIAVWLLQSAGDEGGERA